MSDTLANLRLEVYAGDQVKLAENDDWAAGLAPTFVATGASPLPPGSRDAAVVLTLAAGNRYTAVVRGAGGSSGEALLEIYEVP